MTAVIIIYIYAALLAFACALDVVGLESATKYEHSGRFLFKLQCIGQATFAFTSRLLLTYACTE